MDRFAAQEQMHCLKPEDFDAKGLELLPVAGEGMLRHHRPRELLEPGF